MGDEELARAEAVVRKVLADGTCDERFPGPHHPGCTHQRALQGLEDLVAEVRRLRAQDGKEAPRADYRCARPLCSALALVGSSFCAHHDRLRYAGGERGGGQRAPPFPLSPGRSV